MTTYLIPTNFSSLAVAIPNAGVLNGDILQLEAGYNETLTSTLTINKALTIVGSNATGNTISTLATNNILTMINITLSSAVGKVVFQGGINQISFNHNKTTFSPSDRIFNLAGATGNIPNTLECYNCIFNHLENLCVGVGKDLIFQNIRSMISNSSINDNNGHFSLTGLQGTFLFENIEFNAYQPPSSGAKTRFFILSGSASYPICGGGNGTLRIKNCTHNGVGDLQSGFSISRFDFWGAGNLLELDFEGNNWNVSNNGGVACYRFNSVNGETNILNNFSDIKFKNNNHNANGVGMLSIAGSGSLRGIGAIQGNWILCGNRISQSINNASFNTYHFGQKPPSGNKIFGIQFAIFINPYPTNNPYQDYIDCGSQFQPNYMLKRFNDEILWRAYKTKSPHKNRAEMKL